MNLRICLILLGYPVEILGQEYFLVDLFIVGANLKNYGFLYQCV